jgi:uncharacterized repeat protein (TIGR01451 family)
MLAIDTQFSFCRRAFAAVFLILLCTAAGVAQSPPTIVKSFSAATVGLNESVTLTFTITNPNPAVDLTGVNFNDNLPSGLIIANPDSLTGSCDPGVITPSVTNINLVGATVLANSSCTFSIDVLAQTVGNQVNTTDPVTSNEGGTGGTATASVEVVVPDLTITSTHTGNFLRPQTGATYTLTVTNSGASTTTALVTVTDTLPAGLTATAIDGGPNWFCTLSPLQCTRGDNLDPTLTYDPITLTVNVAANAGATVTNTATVSGGGEADTSNDTATDPTQTTAAVQMAAQTTSLTVAAGASGTSVLNVNYAGGLGAITFACTGLPAATTCSFNPTSVTATGATPVTLTIATTARSATFVPQMPGGMPPQIFFVLLGLAGMAFAMMTKRNARMRLATAFAGMALLLLAGCGGSSKTAATPTPTPTPVVTGTPAGTSAVVVTASSASGGATATSTVNLTVQ